MPEQPQASGATGRYAYEGLDRVMHERARLSILTSLVSHPDGLVFNDLKDLCSLTDGNLSRHLQILQSAELVEIWKGQRHNRSQTLCRLTVVGRLRFLEYVNVLEQLVDDALATKPKPQSARVNLNDGLSPA